ncbi:TetR/AcrR family transcriptional regulator C-terminal ligand-binding domain-containing protein [Streptomyces sp. NRRL S-118]|uniref:TetR/AcrR family transcriptional regulator C-terminal ligand-binding domain-containing protein n=1 Tax=Streptomyces sp. NRRL S-118 TaxID=1463881 RepID=UPI0006941666|nr:TetR/AcrR family transcriptional regulator C-terminal ligand-binding domain-containing protein [Streptomyces sp. NRRL S-118]
MLTAYPHSLRQGLADTATGSALMALAAQADRDADAGQALASMIQDRHQALDELLVPGHPDDGRRVHLLIGPLMFRHFLDREPLTDTCTDTVVTHWLTTTTADDTPPTQ